MVYLFTSILRKFFTCFGQYLIATVMLFIAINICIVAYAQPNINRVEYYIDADPGLGNATALPIGSSNNLTDLNIAINPTTLAEGVHRLYVRARSANGWSMVNTWLFYKPYNGTGGAGNLPPVTNISRIEYYLDSDPGLGNATTLSITPGTNLADLIIPIIPTTLSEGVHRLYVRALSATGWSMVNTWLFYKPYNGTGGAGNLPPVTNISRIEYYLDSDPGFGNATTLSITPGTNFTDLIIPINPTTIAEGVHRLYVRALSATGWSMSNTWLFYKPYNGANGPNPTPPAKLRRLEYYLDTDPGTGLAIPVAISAADSISNLVIPVNIIGLTVGDHLLNLRAQDEDGKWSMINSLTFNVPIILSAPAIIVNSITQLPKCAGDSIKINFSKAGTYANGNRFNLELSDAAGNFASAVVLGFTTDTANGPIAGRLPSHLPTSASYKLRVSSSNPVIKGVVFTTPISITDRLAANTITGSNKVNGTFSSTYSVPSNGSTWQWIVQGGTQISGSNTSIINVRFSEPADTSFAGSVRAIESSTSGCSADTSVLNITAYKLKISNTSAFSNLCKGGSFDINVTADGNFEAGNIYTAQLSNAAGSFASPVNIGTADGSGAGIAQQIIIKANIPVETANGTGYRIRVISSAPAFTGAQNTAAITIGAGLSAPTASVTVKPGCVSGTGTIVITAPSGGGFTYSIGGVYQTSPMFTGLTAGSYSITAQNASGCVSASTILKVIADTIPMATIKASGPLKFCEGGSVTLTSSSANGNNWSNGATTQSITVTNSGNYFVTVGSGACAAISDTLFVTTTPSTTATFAAIGPICAGSQAPLLPATSINGFSGTWAPATISNTTTGTYIFTASAGQCIVAAPLIVIVNPTITPSFAAFSDITPGSVPPVLPTTSLNGITGSWNPSTVSNTTTGTYTFTPNNTQCATTVTITIVVKAALDLAVKSVSGNKSTVGANEVIIVKWNVVNVGTVPSLIKWTERVFIQSLNGDNRTLLDQTTYNIDGILNAGQEIARSLNVTIPAQLSIGDEGFLVVELLPDTAVGEATGASANNTGIQQTPVTFTKLLTLNLSATQITEGMAGGLTATVNRSGSLTNALTFTVNITHPSRFSFPSTVTIPAGEGGVNFTFTALNNNAIQGILNDTLRVTATGFTQVQSGFEILDNDNPSLSIINLPAQAIEGTNVTFQVSTNLAPIAPLQVYLTSNNQVRFTLPPSVIIPAGATSVSLTVNLAQDDIPEIGIPITISAGAGTLNPASDTIQINDDDLPGLTLTIETPAISESAGFFATQATLRRTTGSNPIAFTANLIASLPNTLIVPPSITLAAGENEKTFTIGVIDNILADGQRTVSVTASLLVNSCGCNAPPSSGGSVSTNLIVNDNDGSTLQLSVAPLTLAEGLTNAGLLRVTRNTATTSALVVNLTSSNTSEATLPATVTIPAGEKFIDVPITTLNDGVIDGNKQVYFNTTATGFAQGTVWAMVTDQNKPDLQIPAVTINNTTFQSMALLNYTVSIKNTGFASAPTGVLVYGYLSKDDVIDSKDTLVSSNNILTSISVGQTVQLVNAVTVPNLPGAYKLLFKVNPTSAISELLISNNTSKPISLTIKPNYIATALISSDYFVKGSKISISGTATKSDGTPAASVAVEIHVITNDIRRNINATTNAQGSYTIEFIPLANEAGHYIVGAAYPGINDIAEQDAFDILGVLINDNKIPQFKVILNDSINGTLAVQNLSNKTLTNFTIIKQSLPNGAFIHFDTIPVFAGNTSVNIRYSIIGTVLSPGSNFEVANLQAVSQEAIIQPVNMFYYCQAPNGFIEASISNINVTVSQSNGERQVQFMLTNKGQGSTGNIKINLPKVNWLTSVTPVNLPPLSTGDSALVILKFSALAEVPFNFPVTGSIGISSQNGNSFNIPFNFRKKSETTGAVKIIVTNQFTYYTENAPKVADAHVVIRNYYTNEIYAEGKTDTSGIFTAINVPEGTHKISVDKDRHLPYSNTVNTNPGDTIVHNAFINYQAITFTWTVVPTAIQDQYDITLTTQFETNIPIPVVTIDMPKTMPQLSGNETYAFNATLTNHGLITAKDVAINLPTGDAEYEFITNYVPADLLAQQSIQVPVIMRRRTGENGRGNKFSYQAVSTFLGIAASTSKNLTGEGACTDFVGIVYWYKCNLTTGLWQKNGVMFKYPRTCSNGSGSGTEDVPWTIVTGTGSGGFPICAYCPCYNCGGANENTPPPPAETEKKSCVQCLNDLIQAVLGCGGVEIPANAACAVNLAVDKGGPKNYVTCLAKGVFESTISNSSVQIKAFGRKVPIIGQLLCLKGLLDALGTCLATATERTMNKQNAKEAAGDGVYKQFDDNLKAVYSTYNNRVNWNTEYFGDLSLNDSWITFYQLITNYVDSLIVIPQTAQGNIIAAMAGYDMQPAAIQTFFTRWNNSIVARDQDILVPDSQHPGIINWIRVKTFSDSLVDAHNYAVKNGFESIEDMNRTSRESINEILDNQKNVVCASVTVQLSQKLTMTREAFRGTLEIFNGHPTDAMDSLTVNVKITDINGIPSNGLFEIKTESLSNLSDVTGNGNIAAQQKGSVKFLFIPEIGAAPTTPKLYNFGGSVRYWDPYAKAIIILPLADVQLTVNPSPNLMVHYFMQRNILSDDPLTTPDIEPTIPAQLGVMIENQGYGPAVNLTISSAQPKIIDNEKGLAINFLLTGSNLQGQPENLGVTNINFGTILPLQTRVGQWYFTSSLLGKFVSYDAKFVHANSFGNPDLSLIKDVKLHELTKSIRLYGGLEDGINDFLVNDIFDTKDIPDIIYFSQGNRTAKVHQAASGKFNNPVLPPSFSNLLTITAKAVGWNYIALPDPGAGQYELLSVTRSDGQLIPLDNAWLTFVTLPVSQAPVYENRFHFVDTFSTVSPVTYTVVWKPGNVNGPKILSITGVPETISATQVQTITVVFDKEINPATFTYQDLNLTFQGGTNIIDSKVIIKQVDSVTFTIDISNLTTGNGFYNFTAQAANVTDVYGISGLAGKQYTWTQFLTVPTVQAFLGIPDSHIASTYDTINVLFNLTIDVTTVTPASFIILKDSILVPGAVTIDSVRSDHKLFYLGGLKNILTQNGNYEFKVDLPNIRSKSGEKGMQTQSINLIVDNAGPLITSMQTSNAGGLDSQHVTFINIKFNEDVVGFNTASVVLTRNGEVMPLNIAQLSNTDLQNWMAGNFGLLTHLDGNYTFTVNTNGFTDAIGNSGNTSKTVSWVVNHAALITISNLVVTPDLGFSVNDGITSGQSLNVAFSLSAKADKITISQVDLSGESILETILNVAVGQVSLPFTLQSGGNTGIKITASGANGGTATVQRALFIDQQPLTADWNFVDDKQLTTQVDSISLSFSAKLLSEAGMLSVIRLKINGNPLPTTALRIAKVNDTAYVIYGIRQASTVAGNYEIIYNLQPFSKYRTGIAGAGEAKVNWTLRSTNNAPVANAGTDTTITSTGTFNVNAAASYDLDGDSITYKWIAPEGLVLSDSTSAAPSYIITTANQSKVYSLLLVVSDGSLLTTSVVKITVNLKTTSVSFDGLLGNYCITAPIVMLKGTPAGGEFSGNGIIANTFNPASAGAGAHIITYTYNDTSYVQTTKVNALTVPLFKELTPICIGSAVPLLPAYSTNGITGKWSPNIISDTASATYLFSPDSAQCADTTSLQIIINSLPVVKLAPLPDVCKNSTAFTLSGGLPAGGVYRGKGINSGLFNPAIAGEGTHIITYTYTNTSGCADTSQQMITVINCGTQIIYYIDADKDGYGNADSSIISASPVQGYVTNSTDCNDLNAAINPGAAEVCGNGIDENCDGVVDENCGIAIKYYVDRDKDGYGNADSSIVSTSPVQGYVTNSTDCNDRDATIYPNAPELCDSKDNNCNGQIDEELSTYTYYKDADLDGYGNDSIIIKTCKPITSGWSAKGGDCNDGNPKIHPGIVEICGNGVDDNCNGQIDENDPKPTLNINSISVSESVGKASLLVTLTNKSKWPVTFSYNTVNGSAYNNKDYIPKSFTIIIPAGKLSVNIDIDLVKDNIKEPSEYFDVVLCNPSNALLGTKTGRVTIVDSIAESSPQLYNSDTSWVDNAEPLTVKVMPNPSENYFTIVTSGGSKENLKLKVIDISGRLIEIKKGMPAGETFRIGSRYRTGIYFVEIVQGKQSLKLKLFKK